MTLKSRLLAAAALVGIATVAIAAPSINLADRLVKASRVTLNGFTFDEPAGGSAEVPTVFVFSDDRVRYSRIGYNDRRLRFDLRATQQCGGGKWSESGSPAVSIGDRTWPSVAVGKPVRIGDDGWRPVLDVLRENIDFDAKLRPVERCNQVITDYTRQGELPAGLLQKGFWIKVEATVPASITPGCKYKHDTSGIFDEAPQLAQPRSFMLSTWVRCMPTGYIVTKGPPPKHGKPASEFELFKGIDLSATNSPLKHTCPATIVFRGKINAGRAVRGTYRLVGSGGYETPTYPFELAAGASRSVSWQRRVELPDTRGSLAAPGAGTWPRIVNGWLQIEVTPQVNNAEVHRSGRAQYTVSCLKPPSPQDQLKAPG